MCSVVCVLPSCVWSLCVWVFVVRLCYLFFLCPIFSFFFFSSRRRHTRCLSDWSSDVCSSDLQLAADVGRFAQLLAQLVDGARELLALRAQLAADLLRCACRRHQCFNASVVSLASRIACSGTGGVPLDRKSVV